VVRIRGVVRYGGLSGPGGEEDLAGDPSTGVAQGNGDHDHVVEVADNGMIPGIRSMGEATHSPAITMAILVQRGRPTCGATRI
jgi:hypothetical protein